MPCCLQVSAASVTYSPVDVLFTLTVLPDIIVLEQDVGIADAMAGHLNGSASVSLPLLLTGPPYPTRLGVSAPASVTLDFSGCVGCMDLAGGDTAQVYLSNLHLTGLERPAVGNGSSSGGGGVSSGPPGSSSTDPAPAPSLALWAFRFNRTADAAAGGVPRVRLHNVSVTLPCAEFGLLLLLGGLPAAGAGAGPGEGQTLADGGWSLQVAGTWRGCTCPGVARGSGCTWGGTRGGEV